MLLNLMMKAVVGAFTGLLGLLPAYSLDGSIAAAGTNLGNALSTVNGVVPVTALGVCLLAIIAARLYLFVWSLVIFIYDRFPFKAT